MTDAPQNGGQAGENLPATDVEIQTPFIKLDSLLKFSGACDTGGEAKMLILEGLVSVNGQPCVQRGKKLYPGDLVTFEDQRIRITGG